MPGRLLDPVINVPPIMQQGDTITWIDVPPSDVDGTLYTSADWNLVFNYLQNAGVTGPQSVTGVAQGTGWLTTLTPTKTQALVPGATYLWQVQLVGITDDPVSQGIVVTVDTGSFTVLASIASASAGYDGRSQAVQALQQWQTALAALAGTNGPPVLSYKIGTRELRYRDMEEIQKAIAYWNAVVISEQTASSLAQNQGNPRKLYFRFPSSFGSSA